MAKIGKVLGWTGRLWVCALACGLVACDIPGSTADITPIAPAGAGNVAAASGPAAAAVLATPNPANLPPEAGDWPMYGHDASRTGYNPAEMTLGPDTVGQLVQRWQANVGIGGAPSSSA